MYVKQKQTLKTNYTKLQKKMDRYLLPIRVELLTGIPGISWWVAKKIIRYTIKIIRL